jgi:hypothetical protein
MRHYLFLFSLLFLISSLSAQTYCTKENQELCEATLANFASKDWAETPIAEVAIGVGKHFLGVPYVAKTLEIPGEEKLVVDLQGLDCTTFLENVVVFSRLVKKKQLNYDSFLKELEFLRYRNGEQGAYPSRLHYFSDWIYENAQKRIIQDVTQEVGGVEYENQLSFMSTHPNAYRQLSENAAFVTAIANTEAEISKRNYHYLPKATVAEHESKIQSGDLIAITTGIKGLDIVHVGFALRQNGRIHLFHASTGSNKVEISTKPLAEYLAGNRSQSGIMVCRLVEVE